MKTKALRALLIAFLAILAVAICTVFAFASEKKDEEATSEATFRALSSENVVIVNSDGTDYVLRYSSDSYQGDQAIAKELQALLPALKTPSPDTKEEVQYEILIGNTSRALSSELLDAINAVGDESTVYVWGYAYKDGKLAFTANSSIGFDLGKSEFFALASDDGELSVPSDLFVVNFITRADYEEMLRAEEEANKDKYIAELIKKNSSFTQSQFGGDYQEMPTDRYASPPYYPTDNQHPRLFFIEDDIEDIYNNLLNNPELSTLRKTFWEYANAENFTGIFPERTDKYGETYRFNTQILAQLEAKALAYILTGDEIYGYEAIIGAKNAILSVKYTEGLHMDVYHGPSQVMVNVAKVYDWCYDLMTEDDKNQIIAGVSNVLAPQMESEMRFPPSGMNGVSGHGTGPQFTRDWVTISLAFYDEVPSWWEFVGGRYFEEYVPVIDYCYQGGFASQGTTTYGDSKYFTKGWAAWVIQNATGEFPYVENFHLGAYYYFAHLQPNGKYFQTGDGGRSSTGCSVSSGVCAFFVSAMLFQDPTIAAMAKYYSNNYTNFYYEFTMESTVCDVLIWQTLGPQINEEARENIDLIQYLPYPSEVMTARNSWDEDGAAVLMRMGALTMANHDLRDHGTFQIYYKGLLAGTSGTYNKYGSNVHKYYLQSTVAHNGLLIFDPDLADDEPIWSCGKTETADHTHTIEDCSPTWGCGKEEDGTHTHTVEDCSPEWGCSTHVHDLTTCSISNASRYFYSGSQYARSEANNIENWLSGKYEMAEVYGKDWSYDLKDGSAEWAYISGDLSSAYDSNTVKYAGRKMLAIFTDDPDYPMLFFTYDQMTSADGGENFTKTFLLHTTKEPTIDTENLTAVITEGEGRLFLHSVSGALSIDAIGGSGQAYWINGKNCLDTNATSDNADKIWGRIELSATGNLSDSFLTAMYVTDATNDTPLEVKKLESDTIDGAVIQNRIIAFTKTDISAQQYKTFSFTAEGAGLYTYYVAGIEAGTWNITVDGVSVAYALAEEGGSIITFIAPAGEVILTPGKDVIGANGGKIKYNAFGGVIPDSAPLSYNNEVSVELPSNIKRDNDLFLGWYTSPTFEPETLVTQTPLGVTGNFVIYAKYISTLVDVDFTDQSISIDISEKSQSKTLSFNAKDKAGASFITKTGKDGVQYLEWIKGTDDPIINYTSSTKNYASMSTEDECATFTISLSKNGENPMMPSEFRIYTKKTVTGAEKTTRQYIFTTNSAGEVRLGNSSTAGPLVTTLTSEMTTLHFVMDFKNEEIRAYDDFGCLLASLKVSVNKDSGASSMSEWRKLLDSVVLYWYGNIGGQENSSMRIYGIKIDEGDRVASSRTETSIIYNHGGATLPKDAPTEYSKEVATALPIPTKDGYLFDGWYTSPTFDPETKITEISSNTEGMIEIYASWIRLPDDNEILYNLGGGELPEEYITHFTKGELTKLPIPAKSGFAFVGWYTSPDYDEASRITEIPADRDSYLEVWARWIFSVEFDFSKIDIDASTNDKTVTVNGLQIRPSSCTSLKTASDSEGNKYLELVKGNSDPNIIMTTGQIAKSSNTSISYEFVVGKNGDAPMAEFTFRILSKVDVNGNKLSGGNNQLYMFAIDSTGAYIYNENNSNSVEKTEENKIADFVDGILTVRVEIDFRGECLIGYKSDGTTIVKALTIPEKSGAENGLEYMKTFTEYVMYLYTSGSSSDQSARIYSLKITDDKIFGENAKSGTIEYETNGGTLSEDAPVSFTSDAPVTLPTPYRAGYTFDGWYISDTFESNALITTIPVGASGTFKLYAKWTEIYIPIDGKINYNTEGGTLPDGAPEMFTPSSDTALTLPIPTYEGYTFEGWYTSETLDFGTLVTEIPAGTSGEFTVWASWSRIVLSEDYSETSVDVGENTSKAFNNITYNAAEKYGASFVTKEDSLGNKYLAWTNGENDPIILINNGAIAKMSLHTVSYEIKLARNGDAPFMSTAARINIAGTVGGANLSSSNKLNLYGTTADGSVYLGNDTAAVLGAVPEDGSAFTIKVVVDFENLRLIGFCEDGNVITKELSIPANSGAKTGIEYQTCANTYVFYWQGSSSNKDSEGSSVRIDSIKIAEGIIF